MFFLGILALGAVEIPRGARPETWDLYRHAIDETKQTFECFDKSAVIPLSRINDNYLDCADGSDEPGTSANPLGRFYCENKGSSPKEIDSWEVGDGRCDCCDGSDEFGNPDVTCPNVCAADNEGRSAIIAEIRAVIEQGITMNKNMSNPATNGYDVTCSKTKDLRKQIEDLEEQRKRIQEEGEAKMEGKKKKKSHHGNSDDDEPSHFRDFVKRAWAFTFMIPKSRVDSFDQNQEAQNYDYDYEPPWGNEAQKKIDKIDDKLYKLRESAGSSLQLCKLCENRTEYFPIAGTAFKLGKFRLELLGEVRNDWNDIGKMKSIDRKGAVYKEGMHCWERDKDSKTVIHFKCSNETKLVDMWEISQCKYSGVLLTPLACSSDDLDSLSNMTLSDLQNYRRQILQKGDDTEEVQFYDSYDDDPYRDRYYRDYYNRGGYYDPYDYPMD